MSPKEGPRHIGDPSVRPADRAHGGSHSVMTGEDRLPCAVYVRRTCCHRSHAARREEEILFVGSCPFCKKKSNPPFDEYPSHFIIRTQNELSSKILGSKRHETFFLSLTLLSFILLPLKVGSLRDRGPHLKGNMSTWLKAYQTRGAIDLYECFRLNGYSSAIVIVR